MNKQIIVINGTGGSGKDTFVEFASKYVKLKNFSSIDKVKEIARMIGWDGSKSEKDRKFLSDLKDLTTKYNDMAYNDIKEAIKKFKEDDNKIMFIHIREPEEIERIKHDFNAKTLLIKRLNHEIISSNHSDANIENYNYDDIIINDTLEKLEADAKKYIKEVLSK